MTAAIQQNEKTIGRWFGLISLAQIISTPLLNFYLSAPLFAESGFLLNAAQHSTQIAASVFFGFFNSALSVWILALVYPLFYQRSPSLTLWFTTLTITVFVLQIFEQLAVMNMLSYSQAYIAAAATEKSTLQSSQLIVKSMRNWTHFSALLFSAFNMIIMCIIFFRFNYVPRWLSGLLALASPLQIYSLSLPFFGGEVNFNLLMPVGIGYLVLSIWLLIKGFKQSQ